MPRKFLPEKTASTQPIDQQINPQPYSPIVRWQLKRHAPTCLVEIYGTPVKGILYLRVDEVLEATPV